MLGKPSPVQIVKKQCNSPLDKIEPGVTFISSIPYCFQVIEIPQTLNGEKKYQNYTKILMVDKITDPFREKF